MSKSHYHVGMSDPYLYERLEMLYGQHDTNEAEGITKKIMVDRHPDGYTMEIKSQNDWALIAETVNIGVDAHLEAFTRSTFDASTGKVWIHPEEMHILLRRMSAILAAEANALYEQDPEAPYESRGGGLLSSIIHVMCDEED